MKNAGLKRSKRILRWPQVAERIPLSKSYVYALQAQGKFPKTVKLIEGGRGSGYWEHEIDQWIEERFNSTRGNL